MKLTEDVAGAKNMPKQWQPSGSATALNTISCVDSNQLGSPRHAQIHARAQDKGPGASTPPAPLQGPSDSGSERWRAAVGGDPGLAAVSHWFWEACPGARCPSFCLPSAGASVIDLTLAGQCDTESFGIVAETKAAAVTELAQPAASGATEATAVDGRGATAQTALGEVSSRSPATTAAAAVQTSGMGIKPVHEAHTKADRARKAEKLLNVKQEKADQQSRKRRRTCMEARQPGMINFQEAFEKATLLFGSYGAASITCANGAATFRQLLAVPEGAQRAKAYSALATYCTRMLHACGVGVQRDTKKRGSEEVALEMPLRVLKKLPVLQVRTATSHACKTCVCVGTLNVVED